MTMALIRATLLLDLEICDPMFSEAIIWASIGSIFRHDVSTIAAEPRDWEEQQVATCIRCANDQDWVSECRGFEIAVGIGEMAVSEDWAVWEVGCELSWPRRQVRNVTNAKSCARRRRTGNESWRR